MLGNVVFINENYSIRNNGEILEEKDIQSVTSRYPRQYVQLKKNIIERLRPNP